MITFGNWSKIYNIQISLILKDNTYDFKMEIIMKKLLTIALLLVGITANAQKDSTTTAIVQVAQEGMWSTGMNEADELKGTKAGPYYRYDMEGMGSFILWNFDDWNFKIITEKGMFDVWHNNYGNYYVKVIMGLYTLDGKLIEKFDNTIQADHTDGKSAWINKNWLYFPSHRKKLRKMMRTLKSGDGYIRIVCPRKGMPDFDMKVTKYVLESEE